MKMKYGESLFNPILTMIWDYRTKYLDFLALILRWYWHSIEKKITWSNYRFFNFIILILQPYQLDKLYEKNKQTGNTIKIWFCMLRDKILRITSNIRFCA